MSLLDVRTERPRLTSAAVCPRKSTALCQPGATFVEIGPGNVLSGLLKRIVPGAKAVALGTADEVERFLQ